MAYYQKFNPLQVFKKGKKYGKGIFKDEYYTNGEYGARRADKAHDTCYKYGYDKRVKRNKHGKYLTPKRRTYYKGMANGLLWGYNDYYGKPRN